MKCKICKKRIWPFWAKVYLAEDWIRFQKEEYVVGEGKSVLAHYNCWVKYVNDLPIPEEWPFLSSPAKYGVIEKPPKEWPNFSPSSGLEDNYNCVSRPQFNKIVDLFKCSQNDVTPEDLEAVLTNEDIRTYVEFGYIEQMDNKQYILTRKGRYAYYQNLDFRAQFEEAKKKMEKELSLDTPPSAPDEVWSTEELPPRGIPEPNKKYVASPFATEPDPRKFAVKSRLVEEIGVIKKDDGEKLVAVSGKNTDIVELTYLADALMENGVDPIALLRGKLAVAKNLKRYRYDNKV